LIKVRDGIGLTKNRHVIVIILRLKTIFSAHHAAV